MASVYDFTVMTITGEDKALADFAGTVLLVVNTASKCGFTPQYAGLQKLHDDLGADGFEVLGFPCDQFAHQEPGDEAEIAEFCDVNYGVTFPMFAKIDVNGPNTDPLYVWLKSQKGGVLGSRIKWNFTKFLLDAQGQVIRRYGSTTKPERLAVDIEAALANA